MTRTPRLFLLLFIFFGLMTGFKSDLSDREILRDFELIAFGNEYTGEHFARVRKWVQPIRMGIQGKYPPYFEEDVVQHARDLQTITGHPIELYYSYQMQKDKRLAKDFDKNKVNVILFYLPVKQIPEAILKYFDHDRQEVDRMIRVSTCFAKYFRRRNEIRTAIVVFPSHHPRAIMRACVVEELTQIMGLPNDSEQVKPSIFNDTSLYRELTGHDRLLLRLLYDPKITHNMRREEALEIASEILPTIRRTGSD